jgi:sugar/nucleoside kinase (ribokinase family)
MQLQREVLVVGSVNVDCTVNVKTLPKAGETIHGTDAVYLPGGKGGNQAVAVAQANSKVNFISEVGNDSHAEQALSSLKAFGVDTAGILRKPGPRGIQLDKGDLYPAFMAVSALAQLVGGELLSGQSPDGLLWAIGASSDSGVKILAANLKDQPAEIEIYIEVLDKTITALLPALSWQSLNL